MNEIFCNQRDFYLLHYYFCFLCFRLFDKCVQEHKNAESFSSIASIIFCLQNVFVKLKLHTMIKIHLLLKTLNASYSKKTKERIRLTIWYQLLQFNKFYLPPRVSKYVLGLFLSLLLRNNIKITIISAFYIAFTFQPKEKWW